MAVDTTSASIRPSHKLKIAIVHDWLYGGGAERVVAALHEMYPEAPIYTSYCSDDWRQKLHGKVVTGFLQWRPLAMVRKFLALPRIWWFSHLDLSGYDIVISSSGNGEAMGVRVPPGSLHISYCHTPTHYYWRHYEQYLRQPGFGIANPLARVGLRLLVGPLRRWDYRAAQKPDYLIANSTHIQSDIKKYYQRDSVVIHPPVDIERFTGAPQGRRSGYVTAGRQVPMKRFDLIIAACNQLQLPLTVIGRGPDHDRLVSLAGPTVTFLTDVSDADMPTHFAQAKAFLFASHEDFGITPVEALAAGTPVIAYKAGGALDYVQPGHSGLFFEAQTAESLAACLQSFDDTAFDHAAIQASAGNFTEAAFKHKISSFVETQAKNRAHPQL